MLNEKELDAIQRIVDFGGYVNSNILSLYIHDSDRHVRRILSTLEEEGLLRRVELSRNPSVPQAYQVTKKACVMCNRGDSHMRKKHTPPFTARALLRAHFLFSLMGAGYTHILSAPAVKLEYLRNLGFIDDDLPHKFNAGTPVLQVEEHLLTQMPYAKPGGIGIVHPDKCDVTAMAQLLTLIERYRRVVALYRCPVNFIAVCENKTRAEEFKKAGHVLAHKVKGGFSGELPPFMAGYSVDYSYFD